MLGDISGVDNIYLVCGYTDMSDTPGGAQASATIYTMVEMAKAHKLNVEKYLTFLLTRRPQTGMSDEELEKLVPWSDEARAFCGYALQTAFV